MKVRMYVCVCCACCVVSSVTLRVSGTVSVYLVRSQSISDSGSANSFIQGHRENMQHHSDSLSCSNSNVQDTRLKLIQHFFFHSCSEGVNNKRHRVQRYSVTARRRDRIPCTQACHPLELAHEDEDRWLSVQLTSPRTLRSRLPKMSE